MPETVAIVLDEFIKQDYQPNPFDFLSERDIQAVLFTRLRDRLRSHAALAEVSLRAALEGKDLRQLGEDTCLLSHICPAKSEYRTGTPGRPFDIAILDANPPVTPEDWKKSHPTARWGPLWYQWAHLAIEIKFRQMTERFDQWRDCDKDFRKLLSAQRRYNAERRGSSFVGIELVFVQASSPGIPGGVGTAWRGSLREDVQTLIVTRRSVIDFPRSHPDDVPGVTGLTRTP